jgi:hypothetical protein
MFVSRPFLKIGFSCASALLLVTANASAHDSDKHDTQSYRIAQAELDLALDVRYLKSHGVENFGDFSSFGRNDSGRDDSFGWEDSNHSGKSSKNDRDSRFSFDRHDGWHFEFVDSRHDDPGHGRDNDWGWGNGNGNGSFGGNGGGDCNGGGNSNGGDPICGGNPICGGGDPNGGGDPGNSATPEPRASVLSVIAAGAMALLLVGRNVRRRAGVNRG